MPPPALRVERAASEASLIVHSPPDLVDGSQVIGVCTVTTDDMHPNRYGWMVTDFLRWKSLFQQTGYLYEHVSTDMDSEV